MIGLEFLAADRNCPVRLPHEFSSSVTFHPKGVDRHQWKIALSASEIKAVSHQLRHDCPVFTISAG